MGTTTVVETARRALGPAGVFLPFSRTSPASADQQREAVRRLERAGGVDTGAGAISSGQLAIEIDHHAALGP